MEGVTQVLKKVKFPQKSCIQKKMEKLDRDACCKNSRGRKGGGKEKRQNGTPDSMRYAYNGEKNMACLNVRMLVHVCSVFISCLLYSFPCDWLQPDSDGANHLWSQCGNRGGGFWVVFDMLNTRNRAQESKTTCTTKDRQVQRTGQGCVVLSNWFVSVWFICFVFVWTCASLRVSGCCLYKVGLLWMYISQKASVSTVRWWLAGEVWVMACFNVSGMSCWGLKIGRVWKAQLSANVPATKTPHGKCVMP